METLDHQQPHQHQQKPAPANGQASGWSDDLLTTLVHETLKASTSRCKSKQAAEVVAALRSWKAL